MAFEVHKRIKYIDHIRKIIGDDEKVLFNDDELKSSIDKWQSPTLTTSTATAQNSKYRVCGCRGTGTPIEDLTITVGVAEAVYIIDEAAAVILFDPDDPENGAATPDDGDPITVTFYNVQTAKLISELFFILSSNHAKLKLAHNILGVQMDLKELSDSFYNQSIRWLLEECSY